MAPNFDLGPQQWQNDPHTTGRSYSTPNKFYLNIRPETGPLKASYKGLCTAEELMQEPKKEKGV